MGLRYEIHHISGEENHLADLGSRWGNPSATRVSPTAAGLTGGPRPLMLRLLQREGVAPRKCVIKTPKPKTTKEVKGRDLDLASGLVVPAPTHLVERAWIAKSQSKHVKVKPAGLQQDKGDPPPMDQRPRTSVGASGRSSAPVPVCHRASGCRWTSRPRRDPGPTV